ncbi:hypothetical protein J1N35_001019 [Gossypium stocksii]|uniref:Uncharacterized protein n=1 Tax=Gossypium stocksii TaxID=47602 RepID=A0A9D3WIJ8_9ROSI|nr:hypothetical protein J1N35_001019 [Gossypium stocksii]
MSQSKPIRMLSQIKAEGFGETQPTEVDTSTIEKETIELEEEIEKIESINIVTDHEEEGEANPTPTPLVDCTTTAPPPSTEPMIEQDNEINQIIDEIIKFDD